MMEKARKVGPLKVAVAAASDRDVLEAVKMAGEAGFADPILVGDKPRIVELLKDLEVDPRAVEVVHERDPFQAAQRAVDLIAAGQAQMLMKGLVNTAVFLKAVLRRENGLRQGKLLCHLSAFEIPGYSRLIFMADGAFNIAPGVEEKRQILHNCLDYLHRIGMTEVKVALLAANEVPSPKMPASMDAVALAQLAAKGEFPGAIVEGPLALDGAVSAQALKIKGIQSRINGEADLLLVPSIEVGNVLYKSLVYFAGAESAGVVLGAKVPIVLTSRTDSPHSKLLSFAMALCMYA